MLTTDEKIEVLELLELVFISTNNSRHEVVQDDEYIDCIYTVRANDLLKGIERTRKSLNDK